MLLALDTSAAVSVAVFDPGSGAVLGARHAYEPRQHAELLSPFIEEALAEAGATVDDVRLVVVGQGPGPFTGLRVGLVTGQVFAHARALPLHAVISLDGLALAAARAGATGDVVVATDARRREVYSARYWVTGGLAERTVDPSVGPASDLEVSGAVVVGRGVALYVDAFAAGRQDVAATLLDPSAADLARVAARELGLTTVASAGGGQTSAGGGAMQVPTGAAGQVPWPGVGSPRLRAPAALYLRHPDATPATTRKPVLTEGRS